jgi:hypothetical protein
VSTRIVNNTIERVWTALQYDAHGNEPLEAFNNLFHDNSIALTIDLGASLVQTDYNAYFGNVADSDCADSVVCKKFGWCAAVPGELGRVCFHR